MRSGRNRRAWVQPVAGARYALTFSDLSQRIDATRRHVLGLGALLVAAWIVLLGLLSGVRGVALLYPVSLPPNPYFVPDHALLLYVGVPLWTAAAIVVLLGPGILAALLTGGAPSVGGFALRAFILAFGMRLGLHLGWSAAGLEWSTVSFLTVEAVLWVGLFGLLLFRIARGHVAAWPLSGGPEWRRFAWLLAVPAIASALLLPRIFWQDMTGDGLEVLVLGRSLVDNAFPQFLGPIQYGGLGLGLIAASYPVHWFAMLLGPVEAAARYPALLYLPLLFVAVIALIETHSPRRLTAAAEAAILIAFVSFTLVLGFNAGYDAYTADLASPGSSDILIVLCMAATVLFLWQGATRWLIAFVVLGYFTRPTELLFLFILLAALVLVRSEDRRQVALRLLLAIIACIAVRVAYEDLLVPWLSGGPPAHASTSVLRRLRYLQVTDYRRLLFLIVPTGFLPALSLLAVWRRDSRTQVLALACLGYFAFFYLKAFVTLYHFAPVFVLPLVVWWRRWLAGDASTWTVAATAACAAIAVAMAIPVRFDVYRSARAIGMQTAYEIGDYSATGAARQEAIQSSPALWSLFPRLSNDTSPAERVRITPIVILHYAARFDPSPETAQYLVQPVGVEPPPGFTLVEETEYGASFVRDPAIWTHDLANPPPTDFASRIYSIDRHTLFSNAGVASGNYDFDLARVPGLWHRLKAGRADSAD